MHKKKTNKPIFRSQNIETVSYKKKNNHRWRCQAKSNDHAKSNDLPVSEQISRDFVRGYKYCVTYRMHKL